MIMMFLLIIAIGKIKLNRDFFEKKVIFQSLIFIVSINHDI